MIRFIIRKGHESDQHAIQALLTSHQMDVELAPTEFLMIEIEGQIVGAARLEWEAQNAYLRPIIVNPDWYGKNIGKALVREISNGLSALYVVSRGEAKGFYERLGFQSLPWEQVPLRYQEECMECPENNHCQPEHLVLTRSDQFHLPCRR